MRKLMFLMPLIVLASGISVSARETVKIHFHIKNETIHNYKIRAYQFSKGKNTTVKLYKSGATGSLFAGEHDVTRALTTDYELVEEFPSDEQFGILGFALYDQSNNELAFINVQRINDSGEFFVFFNGARIPAFKQNEFAWDSGTRTLTIRSGMGERFYR